MNLVKVAVVGVCVAMSSAYADEQASHAGHSAASAKMHESMSKMNDDMKSMKMAGDPDKDFATMMLRHHQAGIEMAQEELAHGKDPELKKMSKEMIEDQKKERQKLQSWLSKKK